MTKSLSKGTQNVCLIKVILCHVCSFFMKVKVAHVDTSMSQALILLNYSEPVVLESVAQQNQAWQAWFDSRLTLYCPTHPKLS